METWDGDLAPLQTARFVGAGNASGASSTDVFSSDIQLHEAVGSGVGVLNAGGLRAAGLHRHRVVILAENAVIGVSADRWNCVDLAGVGA